MRSGNRRNPGDRGASDGRPEMFRSSGSVVVGSIAAVVAVVLALLAAFHPDAGAPSWIPAGLFLLAVLVYIAQVRPAVILGETDLVLRNMLGTTRIPWAAIKDAQVRQFLRVRVGERHYDCAAVGRTRRQIMKDSRQPDPADPGSRAYRQSIRGTREPAAAAPAELSFGRFVETKIDNRVSEALLKGGIERRSAEQEALADDVRTERAWPEIVVLCAAVVALVVAIAM